MLFLPDQPCWTLKETGYPRLSLVEERLICALSRFFFKHLQNASGVFFERRQGNYDSIVLLLLDQRDHNFPDLAFLS